MGRHATVGASPYAGPVSDPTALDFWTLAIAIVGAATGLAALGAQVWSFALSGPRIKVGLASSFSPGTDGWFLNLEVMNVGRMPVTLAEYGITFGDGEKIPVGMMGRGVVQHGPSGAHRLIDGEAESWLFLPGPLAYEIQKLGYMNVRGYVRLATGKVVRGRKILNIVTIAKMK